MSWAQADFRRRLRISILLIALGLLAGDLPGAEPADESGTLLASLCARWEGLESQIVSGQWTYRCFHNSIEGQRTLADLDSLLDRGVLDGSPDGLRLFIAEMNGGPYRLDPPWGEGRLVFEGKRRRNDLGPFVHIDAPDVAVFHDGLNRQYDAWRPGLSPRPGDGFDAFRPLPVRPWRPDRWQLISADGPLVLVRRLTSEAGAEKVTFDSRIYFVARDTGLVHRIDRLSRDGSIVSSTRLREWTDLPGDVSWPRILVEAVVQNGVVAVMRVLSIDNILVNTPIPEREFALAAKSGGKIVDHRGASKVVSSLERDVPDIAGWLKDHEPAPPVASAMNRRRDDAGRNLLLAANGVILFVAGCVIWRRQLRRARCDARSS